MNASTTRKVLAVLVALGATSAIAWEGETETKDLTRLTLPDDQAAAAKALHQWVSDRGFEGEVRANLVILRRGGVLINLIPIMEEKGLDRLRAVSFYRAKDEFKDSKELAEATYDRNRAQNLCQVFIDEDGLFTVGSNLTFYDQLTAREFDAFLDLFAAVVKEHILTAETVKLLQ